MVAVIVSVVLVLVKVLVWAAAIINMVVGVEVIVIDAEIIGVGVIVFVLNFALTLLYSVDVLPGVYVDLFSDISAGVMLGVLN